MTIKTGEGIPLIVIVAILAFLTFLCGFLYGRHSRQCVDPEVLDAIMTTVEFRNL